MVQDFVSSTEQTAYGTGDIISHHSKTRCSVNVLKLGSGDGVIALPDVER